LEDNTIGGSSFSEKELGKIDMV